MTKYSGTIEAKEEKKTKTNTQYFCFTIDGKKWNCFDPITNQEFNVGDYVEFETEKKTCCKNPTKELESFGKGTLCITCGNEFKNFENLIPETMKKIDAPAMEIIRTQGGVIAGMKPLTMPSQNEEKFLKERGELHADLAAELIGARVSPVITIQKIIQEDRDSFEIGTPGKLGCLKVYLDFNKPEEAIQKIKNAKKVRDEANKLLIIE